MGSTGGFSREFRRPFQAALTDASQLGVGKSRVGGGGLMSPTASHSVDATVGTEQTNSTLTKPMLARPFKAHSWQNEYMEAMMLWVARESFDPAGRPVRMETLVSLPVKNYYAELASIERYDSIVFNSTVDAARSRRERERSTLYVSTVADDIAQWAFIGCMRNDMLSGVGDVKAPIGNQQRLINVDVGGRSRAFNVWADAPRKGDQLYFITKRAPSPYEYLYTPNGEPVAKRLPTPSGMPILQTYAFSSADGSVPSHNTTLDNEVEIPLTNIDYWEREKRITQLYDIIEYDEASDRVFIRNEPDKEAVPQLIWDQYQMGHVSKVGFVTQLARPAQHSMRVAAHRNMKMMLQLPVLEIMLGYGL
jgi:hypothetical protein